MTSNAGGAIFRAIMGPWLRPCDRNAPRQLHPRGRDDRQREAARKGLRADRRQACSRALREVTKSRRHIATFAQRVNLLQPGVPLVFALLGNSANDAPDANAKLLASTSAKSSPRSQATRRWLPPSTTLKSGDCARTGRNSCRRSRAWYSPAPKLSGPHSSAVAGRLTTPRRATTWSS